MNRTKQRLLVMVLRLSALIVLAVFIVVARHSLAEMWHLARFESLDNGERWGVIKFLGQGQGVFAQLPGKCRIIERGLGSMDNALGGQRSEF